MAGEGGAAVLQVLVQNLIDLSKKEISLIRGFEGEAQNLIQNLGTIQGFLNDIETKAIPNEAVKIWLQRLENAAFEADNVLDELHYHSLSKTINTDIKKKEKVLLTCFSPFIDYARNRKMAVSIQKINKDLDSINKTATELGLQKIVADAPTALDAGVETDSFSADPIFIGRDEAVSEIVKTLITTHEKHVFSILPIVGMGGLGKTTLTRNVFNHQKMETPFGSRIWVHVSQVFDPINLFNKILEDSKRQEKDESRQEKDESRQEKDKSRDTILAELKEALKDKTYLLVLDDVWNEDVLEWEGFLNSLSGVTTTKGNGIIVTTRSTEVASIVGTLPIHHLKGLSEEDCWSIIRAKTFGNEGVPSDVESVGREMAKRCGGLPLAASVVGGVLRSDKSADEWRSIRQKWLSSESEGDNNITKILKLSFNYLPSPSLKKCFAYRSIFPKGEYMEKQKLIEMWMGEGFLGSNEDMESVGDKIYNVLLHSSLLQVAKREEYESVEYEHCVMHDLVHDVASSVLGSSNKADGITRVRYQLIQQRQSSPITKEVAQHLRTLIFQADHQLSHDINFSDFKCLHVLTLEDESLKEFPRSIRKLIHLRNLNIVWTSITHLPDWIGELHHLQTLRAISVRKLPSTIKYLINLRHLFVPAELPAEIGRLTSLQTLWPNFIVRDENGYKIEELGSLNNLKGFLTITGLQNVHGKEEAEKANLSKKSKLIKLSLQWTSFRDDVESIYDENVLEGLQPHSNLKELEIWGFRGKRFPDWTMKMAVRNEFFNQLVEIKCEEIPMLGHLPNLKSLYLRDLRNVKSINSSFYGIGNETGFVFPALETLSLSEMDSLKEWAEVESGSTSEVKVFPQLQSLHISSCNQLMKVPMLGHLPNLSILKISKCPKLTEIPDGLQTLNSLNIEECPDLKRIGCSSGESFTSLAELKIIECHGLMDLPYEMVESSVLETVELKGLSSLSNLPRLIECLAKSAAGLRNLTIVGVPKFIATTVEVWHFPKLHSLYIDVSTEGSGEPSVASVDRILRGCSCDSLRSLSLTGMDSWECLPESIQHLTSLYWLELKNFGMEELPEWIDQCISHEDPYVILSLYDWKRLKCLPSTQAMQRLIKQKQVWTTGCPELQQQSDDGFR